MSDFLRGCVILTNIKWLPLGGLNLSAANLAAAEKLRKFGFALNCGEFGSEKYTKSALCVYDVLAEQESPNILIVTRQSEMYNWYRFLVTSVGADFKMISGAANSLLYFYEESAGLYLISRETLFGDNVLKRKAGSHFKWNLIIIDEELSTDVPFYSDYRKNILWKSDKLLINAPFPARNRNDKTEISELVKSVLADEKKASAANSLDLDESVCALSENSPVMRYFAGEVYGEFSRDVSFVDYGFDESVLTYFRRKIDLKTGLPSYSAGGNVFEQYDCDKNEKEKKIYLKPFFSRSDVEDLRAFDMKLDALMKSIEDILAGDVNARVMIYCCNKNTVEYLRKALVCVYGADVNVMRGELVISGAIKRKLTNRCDDEMAKITIGTDMLGTFVDGPDNVNYVFNYELPASPAVLERRMTRHGSENEAKRKFILFRDKNGVFDTPMLEKTLFLKLGEGFCDELPTRNFLLDIKEKGDIVCNLIKDLRYLKGYSSEVENCADLIKRVKIEYIFPETSEITTAKQLNEFADDKLREIYRLFGLSDSSQAAEITAAVNGVSGLCVVGRDEALQKPKRLAEAAASFGSESYLNLPFAKEAVGGLADGKAQIDELHKGDDFHLKIKQEISELNDCIQYPVLYGIWKYRAKEQDSDHTFKDYIKIYNDGI